MRLKELLETLDRSWQLTPDDELKQQVIDAGYRKNGLEVYHKSDEPNQVIFIANVNYAWEVHHSVILDDGSISGRRLSSQEGLGRANTGFVSTAYKLYQEKLNNGEAIRIVAPYDVSDKSLWSVYKKIIDRIIAKNPDRYQPSKPNDNYIDHFGNRMIAQVIRPWGGKRGIEEALLSIRR